MGWEGLGTAIGTIFSWFTPEQIKARVKDKIKRLKNERKEILKKDETDANVKRINAIDVELIKLQEYISNH